MVTLVIGMVQAASLKNMPPAEVVVRFTPAAVVGLAGVPLASWVCTVIVGEHCPATTVNGGVVNASLVAQFPLIVTVG